MKVMCSQPQSNDAARALIMFAGSGLRWPALILILLSIGAASAFAGANVTDETMERPEGSVWTNTVFDPDRAEASGELNTADDSANDGRQEPVLVPLPAPILAAGTGLGLAWILRKRMIRS